MARYILIDNYSGYIWGDSADLQGRVFTDTGSDELFAIQFARALDESIGEHGRTYEMRSRADSIESGYHVYRADIDGSDAVMVVHDGQDQETIDAVTNSCRYEGFILTRQEA